LPCLAGGVNWASVSVEAENLTQSVAGQQNLHCFQDIVAADTFNTDTM